MSKVKSLHSSPQLVFEQQGVVVAPKQLVSLFNKSQQSGHPIDTVLEVYRRGFSASQNEQEAFGRVNSFINGGKAVELDSDLVEAIGNKKTDRSSFLYMEANPPIKDFAQCSTCQHFMPKSKKCTLFSPKDNVVAEGACGLYAQGIASDDQVITSAVTPKVAGYIVGAVRCENCSWFDKGSCGLYETLMKKMPDVFDLNTKVSPKGCCNAFQPGTNEEYTGSEPTSTNTNKPSSRFDATTQLTKTYKNDTPGQSRIGTIKKVVKELAVREPSGQKIQIRKQPVRGADGKITMQYPGKSSSSGGGSE